MTTKQCERVKTTRGRGSNPESRKNLKLGAASRIWYVLGRGAGIGWSKLFGPYHQAEAAEIVERMEAHNHSALRPMYVASTQ